MPKQLDINRRLAIFYHPLYLEIIELWMRTLGEEKRRVSFIGFMELNIRLQKTLIIEFDLKNAFMSALNDWVKEIQDCLELKGLYTEEELNLELEMQQLPFECTLCMEDYANFQEQFREHKAFSYLGIKVNSEIISKFFFDLCITWCAHLDLELFAWFLLSIYFACTTGEQIQNSTFQRLQDIESLEQEFFETLQQEKHVYQRYKKKNLQYYRAWCEWNYLRMEEVGEQIIFKLVDLFPHDPRIDDLVQVVIKAIDIVNKEITSQISQPSNEQTQENNTDEDQVAVKWYETQKRELTQQPAQQIHVDKTNIKLQKVAPLPDDMFVIKYNEVDNNYILERQVRIPIFGQQKTLIPANGQMKRNIKMSYFQTEKDRGIFYIADDPPQQITEKSSILLHQKPIKRRVTSEKQKINNSFSHNEPQQNSVLGPQFASEFNSFYISQNKPHTLNQFSNDISVRRRDIQHDLPIVIVRGRTKPEIPQPRVSQLHNVKLSIQQIENTRHLWQDVMTKEEMEIIRQNEAKFYHIIGLLKLKFNHENRSEYLKQLNISLNHCSKRDEMGGIVDMKIFHARIINILEKAKKRRRRRRKLDPHRNAWQIKTKFKNRKQREEFKDMFIKPLLQ